MGGEFRSGGGHHYCWGGLVGDRVDTRSYKIVSPPKPKGPRGMSVALAEAKKGSWAQNCEGGKMKRDDKS